MTEELLAHLKHFEGWRSRPYRDQGGLPTIGYGHQIESMDHPALTIEEGEALLLKDVQHYEEMALRMSPKLAEDPRRLAAITDFCFNCGGEKYNRSTLRLYVKVGNWEAAANQNALWVFITMPDGKKVASEWQKKRRAATSTWLREGSHTTLAA